MRTSDWIFIGGIVLFLLQWTFGELTTLPVLLLFVAALLERIEELEARVTDLNARSGGAER